MESPPSGQEFPCPDCGALLSVGADHCWKCRRDFQTTAGSPPISSKFSPSSGETYDNPYLSPSSRETGGTPSPFAGGKIRLFKILVVVATVVLAAGIAFFATCFGGFFVGSAIAPRGEDGLGWGLVSGFVAGGVAAFAVAVSLTRLFRSHLDKTPRPSR